MTGIGHHDNPTIDEAARWLATTPVRQRERPAVPLLRERFGLSAKESCMAIAAANLIKARSA